MSTAQQQRRVVLAEPKEPAGGELATLLNEQGFEVVGHTDDAHSAVALAVTLNADLLIVEVPTAAQGLQAGVDEITAAAVTAGQLVAEE